MRIKLLHEDGSFGRAKERVFRGFLKLTCATQPHDFFQDVFRMIGPKALDVAFGKVMANVAALLKDGDVIAIDGKAPDVLRRDPSKTSPSIKLKRAGWDDKFLGQFPDTISAV